MPNLWAHQIRVRRPAVPSADPKAAPGGTDFQSKSLPNANWDCEAVDAILPKTDWSALRACFESFPARSGIEYRLVRVAAPKFELRGAEENPECIGRLLPEFAVPREIIYRSKPEKLAPQCYSSRLNIEADEKAGIKLPTSSLDLAITFPLSPAPKTDDELRRLVSSWMLTPFFRDIPGGASGSLKAQIVPERICLRCMGEVRIDNEVPRWP